jgi:60 kDa SS-A/Ro ribonucleoprotein
MKISNHFAILRNLRNITEAGVSEKHLDKIRCALRDPSWAKGARRILPFRYVAAARACPQLEPDIDIALQAAIAEMVPLPGLTFALVDVSGSMSAALSRKSDLTRMDAAATLSSILPGQLRMFTFSSDLVEVPPRRGMAGVDAIRRSQPHGATYLGRAVNALNSMAHDRIIVITDEQSHDTVPAPKALRAYMINVASNRNGVGYGPWTHIDGFSEGVLRYIAAVEARD